MYTFLSLFESGRFGQFIGRQTKRAWRWITGRKPTVNPSLMARLKARKEA